MKQTPEESHKISHMALVMSSVITETWLKPDIHTAEIFPCHLVYQISRDDRTSDKGGGVHRVVTNKFLSEEQAELKTDCIIMWSKIPITGKKDIYVSSFYKPREHDEHSQRIVVISRENSTKQSHMDSWRF